jgi:hypothetical protein
MKIAAKDQWFLVGWKAALIVEAPLGVKGEAAVDSHREN